MKPPQNGVKDMSGANIGLIGMIVDESQVILDTPGNETQVDLDSNVHTQWRWRRGYDSGVVNVMEIIVNETQVDLDPLDVDDSMGMSAGSKRPMEESTENRKKNEPKIPMTIENNRSKKIQKIRKIVDRMFDIDDGMSSGCATYSLFTLRESDLSANVIRSNANTVSSARPIPIARETQASIENTKKLRIGDLDDNIVDRMFDIDDGISSGSATRPISIARETQASLVASLNPDAHAREQSDGQSNRTNSNGHNSSSRQPIPTARETQAPIVASQNLAARE